MAVVQRVIEDTGADTDTFCKWLMSSKVKVGGPLSGICHWFTSPERSTERRNSRYNILTHRHDLSRHEYDIMSSSTGPQRTSTYSGLSHINESTSISIIMILATVLFILIITAFVTCIIRKKRRPQVKRSDISLLHFNIATMFDILHATLHRSFHPLFALNVLKCLIMPRLKVKYCSSSNKTWNICFSTSPALAPPPPLSRCPA